MLVINAVEQSLELFLPKHGFIEVRAHALKMHYERRGGLHSNLSSPHSLMCNLQFSLKLLEEGIFSWFQVLLSQACCPWLQALAVV